MIDRLTTSLFAFIACAVIAGGASASDSADYTLHFKSRSFTPSPSAVGAQSVRARDWHGLIQFEAGAMDSAAATLKAKGVRIEHFIPDYTVAALIPAGFNPQTVRGVRWVGSFGPLDKLDASAAQQAVVEFFPDTTPDNARAVIVAHGGSIVPAPSLPDHVALAVFADVASASAIAREDCVAWVGQAPEGMTAGQSMYYCAGASTRMGPVPNYVATGDGWDGPGLGSASLTYSFRNFTSRLSAADQKAEIERALAEWARYAALSFTETSQPGLARCLEIGFYSRDHGDGYAFDGPGTVLAHCFFPSPPNPESIAGDLHFDADENWNIGSDIDLFSVALHELGHGLGLNHSSDTNAVMYAYYKRVSGLHSDDIQGIQSLYMPKSATPPPAPPAPANDQCAGATNLTSGAVITQSTSTATSDADPASLCGVGIGKVVWFRYTAPSNGTLTVTTAGSSYDTVLGLLSGVCGNWQTLACNDDDVSGVTTTSRLSYNVAGGVSYLLLVGGYASGSGSLRISANFAAQAQTPPPAPSSPVVGDFNGDGKTDLLWHHRGVGSLCVWFMNGRQRIGSSVLTPSQVPDTRWWVVGTPDMNGDGKPDLLWRHQGVGSVAIWFMNGVTRSSAATVGQMADVRWRIGGVGDFNADGHNDILWQNTSDGSLLVWLMDGATHIGSTPLTPAQVGDPRWWVVAVRDINQDGKPDLIWRHQTVGALAAWLMNGTQFVSGTQLSPNLVPDPNWTIASAYDISGDGKTDLIWQHVTLGSLAAWSMDGTHFLSGGTLSPDRVTDMNWRISGP